MNIKAFRQDLAQKAQEAKKTYLSEDKINVTFSGLKSESEHEKYKALAEALQVQVEDLVHTINETYVPKKTNIRLGSAEDRRRIEEAGKKPREPKKDPAKDEKYPSKKIEESVRKVVDVLESGGAGYSDNWRKSFIAAPSQKVKTEDEDLETMRDTAERVGGIPKPDAELEKMRDTAERVGGIPKPGSASPSVSAPAAPASDTKEFSQKPIDAVIRDAQREGMQQVKMAKAMSDYDKAMKQGKEESQMPYSERASTETETQPEADTTGPSSDYATSERASLIKGMVQDAMAKARGSSTFNPNEIKSSQEKNYSPMPASERLRQAMTSGRKPAAPAKPGQAGDSDVPGPAAPKFDYGAETLQMARNLRNRMNK